MTTPPLVAVLHETIIDIDLCKALHADPEYYGSYHTIVDRYGRVHYMVPPNKKAYAAARSSFTNPYTGEIEQINGSVDDFAYHIALETPDDGRDVSLPDHSGYTYEQYDSLAWLLRSLGVDLLRVALHGQIKPDQTLEPRCLNTNYLFQVYNQKENITQTIDTGIRLFDDSNIEDANADIFTRRF